MLSDLVDQSFPLRKIHLPACHRYLTPDHGRPSKLPFRADETTVALFPLDAPSSPAGGRRRNLSSNVILFFEIIIVFIENGLHADAVTNGQQTVVTVKEEQHYG